MSRCLKFFFAFTLLGSAFYGAGVGSAEETKKYLPTAPFNGNNWQTLQNIDKEWAAMFKVCLVRGIYEGSFALDPQNAYEQYGPWVSFRELVLALDRFYSAERNRQIPVTYALVMIAKNPSAPTPKPVEPPEPNTSRRVLVSLDSKI